MYVNSAFLQRLLLRGEVLRVSSPGTSSGRSPQAGGSTVRGGMPESQTAEQKPGSSGAGPFAAFAWRSFAVFTEGNDRMYAYCLFCETQRCKNRVSVGALRHCEPRVFVADHQARPGEGQERRQALRSAARVCVPVQ